MTPIKVLQLNRQQNFELHTEDSSTINQLQPFPLSFLYEAPLCRSSVTLFYEVGNSSPWLCI